MPFSKFFFPIPVILAFEFAAVAYISTLSRFSETVTLYVVVFGLNPLKSSGFIPRFFRFALLDFFVVPVVFVDVLF